MKRIKKSFLKRQYKATKMPIKSCEKVNKKSLKTNDDQKKLKKVNKYS